MSNRILIIIAIILVNLGCTNKKTDRLKESELPIEYSNKKSGLGEIDLNMIGSIGSDTDEKYMFSIISDMAVDKNGNLFVLDKGFQNLRIFNNNGIYIKEHKIRNGQGPGEFVNISSIDISDDDDEILCYDSAVFMVTCLSKDDFSYKRSIRIKPQFSDIYGYYDKSVTTVTYSYGVKKETKLIYNYDKNGNEINRYGSFQDGVEELVMKDIQNAIPPYSTQKDSFIYISFSYPYDIRIYNNNTKKLMKRFAKKTDYYGGIVQRGEFKFPGGSSCGIVAVDDSLILNFIENKKDNEIYIHAFDYNGLGRGVINMTDYKLYPIQSSAVSFNNKIYLFSAEHYPCPMIETFLIERK